MTFLHELAALPVSIREGVVKALSEKRWPGSRIGQACVHQGKEMLRCGSA